jgi:hypothetical protein
MAATYELRHSAFDRRRYRAEIETLLEQIRSNVGELQRLKVAGVRGAALADRKTELRQVREQLARVIRFKAGADA